MGHETFSHLFHTEVQKEVVSAVIIRNKKILLLKRSLQDTMPGLYELPGGTVDPNETQEGALKREIFEETKLSILSIGALVVTFDFFSRPETPARNFSYLVTTGPGRVRVDKKEHESFRYVRLSEAHRLPLTENAQKTISALKKL